MTLLESHESMPQLPAISADHMLNTPSAPSCTEPPQELMFLRVVALTSFQSSWRSRAQLGAGPSLSLHSVGWVASPPLTLRE